MPSFYGNVTGGPATPHPSYRRYVAVMDVLGMKAWLRHASARTIAEGLDEALVACGASSQGITAGGVAYGPLVGVTHFSDTLLAWSPDDSWASFVALCGSVKMIVGVALLKGVPLRGSIASGEVVCLPSRLRFVGQPIADAFLWSEDKQRPYKSVGVDIVPSTIQELLEKVSKEPVPDCWCSSFGGVDLRVLHGECSWSRLLTWHSGLLFLNHWEHGIFAGDKDPRAMFSKRGLVPQDAVATAVEEKLNQMMAFFEANGRTARESSIHLDAQRTAIKLMAEHRRDIEHLQEQEGALIELDLVRIGRERQV